MVRFSVPVVDKMKLERTSALMPSTMVTPTVSDVPVEVFKLTANVVLMR